MRFFPSDTGKMATLRGGASKWPFSLLNFLAWEKSHVARGRRLGLTNYCALGPQGTILFWGVVFLAFVKRKTKERKDRARPSVKCQSGRLSAGFGLLYLLAACVLLGWRGFLPSAGFIRKRPYCRVAQEQNRNETGTVGTVFPGISASPKPHPSKPHPCNMPQAKTEVVLQFSESCAAKVALQHSLFCNAEITQFYQKLRCSKRKPAEKRWKNSVVRKWRFPAAFLRISSSHV